MVDTEDTAVSLSLSSFSLLSKLAGLSATANISAISLSPDSQTCLVSFSNPDLILLKDHDILAVLDKDKQMPEPSNKLYFTDPQATPDTDSLSLSSLGSKLKTTLTYISVTRKTILKRNTY